MWIRALSVSHFAGIKSAELTFDRGLNVLHGPNELGKSTLARAIRAALLLQDGATAARELVDWHTDQPPQVTLTFETEPQRIWRVRKCFGTGTEGWSYLDFSRDGVSFSQEAKGRDVDGRIRELLPWGLPAPGGKGRRKAFAESFLTTTLLADQDGVRAVLTAGLEDDAEESGKQRLTEALQALAEHPLFREVFEATQARVNEAFTSTGQKSRRRGSPWIELRDRRQAAEKRRAELRAQASDSEGARKAVEDGHDRLSAAVSELEVVEAVRERLLAARRQHEARVAVEKEIATAAAERDRIQGLHDALDQARKDLEAAGEEVSLRRRRLAEAVEAQERQQTRLDTARRGLAELESGAAEQQRTIRRQDMEKRLLKSDNRRRELEAARARAETLRDLESETESLGAEVTTEQEKLAEAKKIVARARDQRREDEAEIDQVSQRLLAMQLVAAREALHRARGAADEATTLRDEASRKAERAASLRTSIEALDLPGPEPLNALRLLETDLRVAEESLEVGLSVEIRPTRPLAVTTRADDGQEDSRRLAGGAETVSIEAVSHLQLRVDDTAEIEITGGSRDARERATTLRERWGSETASLFLRLGVASLDAVLEKCRDRETILREADELIREAERDGERAEALTGAASSVDGLRKDVERLERELTSVLEGDGHGLEDLVAECATDDRSDIPTLEEHRRSLRDGLGVRALQASALERQVSKDEGVLETKQAELVSKETALETRRQELSDTWESTLTATVAGLGSLLAERRQLEEELEALQAGAGDEVEQARATVREAEQRVEAAEASCAACRQQAEEAQRARDRLAGEGATRGELVEKEDLSAARIEVDALTATLEALPVPEADVDESDLASTEDAVRHWIEARDTARAEIQKAEGALQQVGGQYIQEQLEQAEEAIKAIEEREREVELDYGAWQLLRETLREAETEDAVHLGKALVEPVSRRMTELTGGPYGDVTIGPTLSTESIDVAGTQRDLTRLSVGTQDQLATVLRLTIAEFIGSTVVLDDQLVQSDASRMEWLHGFMQECAEKFQILVLTCRPAEYEIRAGAAVRSIDLVERISRTA